jgi:hypothetical protein
MLAVGRRSRMTTWKKGGWLFGRDGTRPGWYGSWQNLNEGPAGAPKGSALWHGRAWLYPSGAGEDETLRACWRLGLDAGLRLALNVDSADGEVLLSVGVGVAALYLAAESRGLRKFLWGMLGMRRPSRSAAGMLGYEREVSVSFHDRSLWWRAWADPHEWSEGTPRWRDGSLDLDRLVRGPARVVRTELRATDVLVPMPEGSYRAAAVLEEVRLVRPRWPDEVSYSVKLDLSKEQEPTGQAGIPIPGKGENSWDVDDDAIYESSTSARTFAEAVGELVGSVLARRERHGGKDWRPPPREPVPAAA